MIVERMTGEEAQQRDIARSSREADKLLGRIALVILFVVLIGVILGVLNGCAVNSKSAQGISLAQ